MSGAQKLIDGLSGFTAGPWLVDPMPGVDGKHDVWTGWDDLICENARSVNAALIAAAPELLNAVVALIADNAKLRAALIVWEAAYDNTLMRSGVCCCGDDMETHSPPMNCGHSPVDSGEYYASSAIMQTRAVLEATK